VPPKPGDAIPVSVAVPSPLSEKKTPVGSEAEPSDRVGDAGKVLPVVIWNVPITPTVKVVDAALVMVGASFTVKVKDCVASGPVALWAVMVNEYVPPVPTAGVPAKLPVPSVLSTKLIPPGNPPVSVRTVPAGNELPVVTAKVPAVPTTNVVDAALVIDAASFTVNVNDCVASGDVAL
jgi:hypothetical protein